MWEISNANQVIGFLYSIILGIIFTILYDFIRSVRIIKPHTSVLVFLEDVIFFTIIAVVTFIFCLGLTAGEIRGYILIGILAGFLLFFFTLSRYCINFFVAIFKVVCSIARVISKGFYFLFEKNDEYITKFFKNTLKYFKKGLKKVKVLLYTIRNDKHLM